MNLEEPDQTLAASVQAEVDAEYPAIELPELPTEEDLEAHGAREAVRRSEFSSRYDTRRWAAILADRDTLDPDLKAEVEMWEASDPEIRASGRPLVHGDLEKKWREWAASSLSKKAEKAAADLRKAWETPWHFLQEFTPAEKNALNNHPDLSYLGLELATYPGEIWSDHPLIVGALAACVAGGVLAPERRTEIVTV